MTYSPLGMIAADSELSVKARLIRRDLTEGRFSAQHASLYARRNDAVDLATKIVELVDDPARRCAMGAFGRRRVEQQLEWRHEAPRLLAAYDALWGGSARRSGFGFLVDIG